MVLLQLKDPLEPFVKRGKYLPGSGSLYHRVMTLADESDVKRIPSFLLANDLGLGGVFRRVATT